MGFSRQEYWRGCHCLLQKNRYKHAKLSRTKELGGKTGVLVGLDLPLVGGGTEVGVWSPQQGNCLRGETFKAESETADLWQPKWNENQAVLATAIYAGQEHGSPGRDSGWEPEFRDCGAIPVRGLLLTVDRQIEGMWGRRLWWEMPVEENLAAMEARWYCWVMHKGWSHHHSLSLPTHQHWQMNSREAGPSNPWDTELQSRTQDAPLSAWCAKQQRRTPGKGAL